MLISPNGQRILKILHLIATSCWLGGCFALTIVLYASANATTGDELFGILKSYKYVSVIVTVYIGAYGSLFTGLAYSLCTNRGFIRHKWIIIKWVMTLAMIFGGSTWLGPWSTELLEMACDGGLTTLGDPKYQRIALLHLRALLFFLALFIIATVLSVYKPWEKDEILAQQRRLYRLRG